MRNNKEEQERFVKGTAKKSSWACPEAELVKINLEKHLTDSK